VSYGSESVFSSGTRSQDVRELLTLLGYERRGLVRFEESGPYEEYSWFSTTDYRSWSGVYVAIYKSKSGNIALSTYSPSSRSYFDLEHQNRTISLLKRRLGGKFGSDEGLGRYMKLEGPPPLPAASGCHLAFQRFGQNLVKAKLCHESRSFPNPPMKPNKRFSFLQEYEPRIIANNTLVPFLVAAVEDYLKSTFVALLKYSSNRELFFKNNVRLQGDRLSIIAAGNSSVEDQAAEMVSFQRISAVCRHFNGLDAKLDLARILRKPYRRRKETLFDAMESLTLKRNDFIHRATMDLSLNDGRIDDIILDLDVAVTRIYKLITAHYGWSFDKGWSAGRRRSKDNALTLPTNISS
jgi:hypothetical protein